MSRLRRFEDHRFIGTRDDMIVYDCDDEASFEVIEERAANDELLKRNLMQSFAPDSMAEARNRGFRPL